MSITIQQLKFLFLFNFNTNRLIVGTTKDFILRLKKMFSLSFGLLKNKTNKKEYLFQKVVNISSISRFL
jgi:hypothetical protein